MWGQFGVDVFVDGKICRINEEWRRRREIKVEEGK